MPLYLLTHSREQARATNTGQLVQALLANHPRLDVQTLIWQRKEPPQTLLTLAQEGALYLVYPASEEAPVWPRDEPFCLLKQHLVLLDATWQESQKMLNQSPYLHQAPRISLNEGDSTYALRRNQQPGALCTAEVVAHVLASGGFETESAALLQRFVLFNQRG